MKSRETRNKNKTVGNRVVTIRIVLNQRIFDKIVQTIANRFGRKELVEKQVDLNQRDEMETSFSFGATNVFFVMIFNRSELYVGQRR